MDDRSLGEKAFKGATWLAFFKFVSQTFAWAMTVAIARVLLPDDYGLMALATIITGYAAIISELGLGGAIVQRPQMSQQELSSVFWFAMSFSCLLGLSCFPLAYVTARLFDDSRVIPLTQACSVLFLLSGLQIVPLSLLKKKLAFKSIGLIEMISNVTSSIGMLVIALMGGGVWSLFSGLLIRSFVKATLLYSTVKWSPNLCFHLGQVRSYLTFGINLALGNSLFYIWGRSDVFFAGRFFPINTLGVYTFALQLSQIPTEKIVNLINQVSYPALSLLQSDKRAFNNFYLNASKTATTLVLPLFIGGFLVGEELIQVLFNEKWYAMTPLFRYLCLSQIFTALASINAFSHAAQGRPHWALIYQGTCVILMPTSFYFAARHGLYAMAVPWLTTFIFLCTSWTLVSLRKFGIPIRDYLRNIFSPLAASTIMVVCVVSMHHMIMTEDSSLDVVVFRLLVLVITGAVSYLMSMWHLDRDVFTELNRMLRKAPAK